MIATDILKVIYAPQKAFKQVIQNPKYWGPLVIIVIFIIAFIGSSYVVAQRTLYEQTAPAGVQGDVWTEKTSLWQASPGVTVSNNTVDYINATSYYGKTSIEFTGSNLRDVSMQVSFDGSVNCSPDGFRNVSLRVKLLTPSTAPANVSLYLNSLGSSSFYRDLTNVFSNGTINVWYNITLPLGTTDWVSSGADANWANITGLKMDFAWQNSSSVDLRLDGLFFRGQFTPLLEIYGTSYLAQLALTGSSAIIFEWILLSGLMYLLMKGLKANATWKPLMVAVGFALIVLIIQQAILVPVYTLLPNTYVPLEILAGVPAEANVAFQTILSGQALVSSIYFIMQIAIWAWLAVLGTLIVREIGGLNWPKSILVAVVSLVLTIIILVFLGIG